MIEQSVLIAINMSLTEVVKRLDILNPKLMPVVSLCIGILLAVFYNGGDIKTAVFSGIVIGLSTSGLYSGSKNVIQYVGSNGQDNKAAGS